MFGQGFKTKEQEAVALWLFTFLLNNNLKPDILQCDNGGEFINRCVAAVFDLFNMQEAHGRPRHPQSQATN